MLLGPNEAAKLAKMSRSTLNNRRYDGTLIKDVHYIVRGPNVVLYLEEAFRHWALHGHTDFHQEWLKAKALETAKTSKRKHSA